MSSGHSNERTRSGGMALKNISKLSPNVKTIVEKFDESPKQIKIIVTLSEVEG